MARITFILLEVSAAAAVFLPVYGILYKICLWDAGKTVRYTVRYFLFSCYLAAVYALVGLPNVTYVRLELNLNVVPFIGMVDDWKNCILNVLLFVPLGFLLPVFWKKYRAGKRTVLLGLGVSLAIELLQIFTFRATDVNDLITNALGTALGYFAGNLLVKRCPEIRGEKGTGELRLVFLITVAVMFFAHPFLSAAFWKSIS